MELAVDATETDDDSVIGDECHIIAREANGPRGQLDVSPEQRDQFDNLILLCKNHHKEIDDQPSKYTVEKLHHLKDQHIAWVTNTLRIDSEKQRDEELLLTIVDGWEALADLDHWTAWTSWIFFEGQPRLENERNTALSQLVDYLYNRVHPDRHPDVRRALNNFSVVLNDFLGRFIGIANLLAMTT